MSQSIVNRCNLLVILAVGFALWGCEGRRVEQLNSRLNAYWEGLRWRNPGSASMLVAPEKRQSYLGKLTKQLDTIRVVDYNIASLNVEKDRQSATAIINYSYYSINENDLHSTQELQQWDFVKDDGWLLHIRDTAK